MADKQTRIHRHALYYDNHNDGSCVVSYDIKDIGLQQHSQHIVLNIQSRIDMYLRAIEKALNSFDDIIAQENVQITVELFARILKIAVQDMALTSSAGKDAPSLYKKIKQFYNDTEYLVFSVGNDDKHTLYKQQHMYTFTSAELKHVCNNLVAFSKRLNNCLLNTPAGTLMTPRVVLNELRSFALELSRIKQINLNYTLVKTDVATDFRSYSEPPGTSSCCKSDKFGAFAQIMLSPYRCVIKPVTMQQVDIVRSTPIYDETEKIIDMNCLVASYDAISSKKSYRTFPLTPDGSNGILAANAEMQTEDLDLLDSIDIKNLFQLEKGQVISRKKIINAIDFIFSEWLANIKQISYAVSICHTNCHTNNVILNEQTLIAKYNRKFNKYFNFYRCKCICRCTNQEVKKQCFSAKLPLRQIISLDSTLKDTIDNEYINVCLRLCSSSGCFGDVTLILDNAGGSFIKLTVSQNDKTAIGNILVTDELKNYIDEAVFQLQATTSKDCCKCQFQAQVEVRVEWNVIENDNSNKSK